MMKFSHTFLLLFIALANFAQNTLNKDTLSVDFLEKKEIQLQDSFEVIPFEDTKENTYRLITLIKKKKKTIDKKNSALIKRVNDLHINTLYFLTQSVHETQMQYDSLIYYNSYVKKLAPVDKHILGKFEILSGRANQQLLNYAASVNNYRNAIDYFKASKHPNSHLDEVIALSNLADLYIYTGSISNAEEMLSIIATKLSSVGPKNLKLATFFYKIYKSDFLTKTNKKKQALALLEEVKEKDILSNYNLFVYHLILAQSYLSNKMPDMALIYIHKLLKLKTFTILNTDEKQFLKHSLLADAYLQKEDLKKTEYHINKLLKMKAIDSFYEMELAELYVLYYKKTKDFKKAFTYLEKINHKKDSINTANTKIVSDIVAYNIKRDTKITQLNKINELKIKAEKKSKQTVVVILILSSLFCMLWIYFSRKKKRLKLELELEKSKEIIAAKNNFLENISHEIRTPITIISGYLSLIKEHTLEPQKIVNYSNNAILNTEKMLGSFNDFLTLFRLEKNVTYLQKTSTKNINSYIRELVVSFKANCELKHIDLFYKSNIAENSIIEFDYEVLKKMVYNLVSNAIKYSNTNTSIFVSSLLENNTLQIVVKDQGIGIDKKEQKAIFERFYQSKKHAVTDGFGIGLSLVFELVNKMNGTITLESEENVGSLFQITLPLHVNQYSLHIKEQQTDFEKLTENKTNYNLTATNLPKALIVDDNLELISYLKELFSLTLDCTFASNGQEGLAFATKSNFDIIISDLRMPIMDGIEFKSEINKLEYYKETPFIMITATPFEALSDLKITLGFDDYIVKPFTKNEILIRVKSLLEKNIYRKKMFTIDADEINFESSYSDLAKKMNTVILKHLNNPEFDVKMLASECGYTQKQLYKIVQSKTGLTLVNIILEVRLLKAYELILKGVYTTMGEVMFAVGINSRAYFGKKFKERFGIKANELKKQQTPLR